MREIAHRFAQIDQRWNREQIFDLALRRADADRRDEDHFREEGRIVRRHLGSNPSAERKPDRVNRREILLANETRNES